MSEELVPDDACTEDIPGGVLEDEKLQDLRLRWEADLDVITIFVPFRATDEPNTLCVVLEEEPGPGANRFHCHRYMRKLDGGWDVSADGQGVTYKQTLHWIPSPRAI